MIIDMVVLQRHSLPPETQLLCGSKMPQNISLYGIGPNLLNIFYSLKNIIRRGAWAKRGEEGYGPGHLFDK